EIVLVKSKTGFKRLPANRQNLPLRLFLQFDTLVGQALVNEIRPAQHRGAVAGCPVCRHARQQRPPIAKPLLDGRLSQGPHLLVDIVDRTLGCGCRLNHGFLVVFPGGGGAAHGRGESAGSGDRAFRQTEDIEGFAGVRISINDVGKRVLDRYKRLVEREPDRLSQELGCPFDALPAFQETGHKGNAGKLNFDEFLLQSRADFPAGPTRQREKTGFLQGDARLAAAFGKNREIAVRLSYRTRNSEKRLGDVEANDDLEGQY